MVPTTSTTLLRQIGGDVHHARWAGFIARYTPTCRQYLRRHFPSLEADDILQETFSAIAQALPNYHYAPEEKGHFRNYLVGVLRNKALMALRKQKRNEEVLADYADDMESRRPGGGTGGTRACTSAVPVLIDLGLVKDMTRDPDASGTSLSLIDGHVAGVGTPGYAAPEQLVGDVLSPAADIHALGMLATAPIPSTRRRRDGGSHCGRDKHRSSLVDSIFSRMSG
ncbi:MAG: hypothetical protein IJ658_02710 [Kiritimatiellae bacterium]|nr:hypothetical protein [Kiritimatiellia bacterium]